MLRHLVGRPIGRLVVRPLYACDGRAMAPRAPCTVALLCRSVPLEGDRGQVQAAVYTLTPSPTTCSETSTTTPDVRRGRRSWPGDRTCSSFGTQKGSGATPAVRRSAGTHGEGRGVAGRGHGRRPLGGGTGRPGHGRVPTEARGREVVQPAVRQMVTRGGRLKAPARVRPHGHLRPLYDRPRARSRRWPSPAPLMMRISSATTPPARAITAALLPDAARSEGLVCDTGSAAASSGDG